MKAVNVIAGDSPKYPGESPAIAGYSDCSGVCRRLGFDVTHLQPGPHSDVAVVTAEVTVLSLGI